jgi:phage I-like protein
MPPISSAIAVINSEAEKFHPYGRPRLLSQFRAMDEHFTEGHDARGTALDVLSATLVHDDEADDARSQWIELIPAGDFTGRDSRGPFRLANPQAVIGATLALGMAAGIPIDYDHATDFAAPQGLPAPAAGWIKQLEVRDGALWGRVEWTPHGTEAIASREYRYISPVFEYSQNGEVTRLLRAGLTNNPNLYLTAISARAAVGAPAPAQAPAKPDGDRQKDSEMETFLGELREILGLDDDATSDNILEKIRKIAGAAAAATDGDFDGGNDSDENDGTRPRAAVGGAAQAWAPDPARYVSVSQFQKALTELNRLKADRARERAEYAVAEAVRSGKLIPAQREWAISYCQADAKGFAAFVAKQPAMLTLGGTSETGFDGEPRGASERSRLGRAATLNQSELAICAQLGVKPEEFSKRKHGSQGDFLKLNNRGMEQTL